MLARRLAFALLLLALGGAVRPLAAATASLVADVNSTVLPFHLYDFGELQLTPFGDRILFEHAVLRSSVGELWVSDGTDAGTQLLHEPFPSGFSLLGVAGKVAFFTTGPATELDQELWRTDGTRAGTFRIDLPPGRRSPLVLGAAALFFTRCPASADCELWRSDGTPAGTVAIARGLPGDSDHLPGLVAVGSGLELLAFPGSGTELWWSAGTPAGALRVGSFKGNVTLLPAFGSHLPFVATGTDGVLRIWVHDGTQAAPRPLRTLATGTGAAPLKALGSTSYFLVFSPPSTSSGPELWASDGTPAGTLPVTAFGAGSPLATGLYPLQMEKVGSRLLFLTRDSDHGARLWTSGGSPGSTALLAGCPGGCPTVAPDVRLVAAGERIFFRGSDPAHAAELWVSDGTSAGTHRVLDLCPGACDSSPGNLTALLGRLYFEAFTPSHPNDVGIFKSDGTAAGTRQLITSRAGFASPPVAAGGKIFWSAAPDDSLGPQLWVSDGTPEGTSLVSLIGADRPSSLPQNLVAFGDQLLWNALAGDQPFFAWSSRGAGAVQLAPTGAGAVVVGSRAFFVENPDSEPALWVTDGTAAGTVRLLSLPGRVKNQVADAGRLVFTVNDSTSLALWASDGTAAGTVELVRLPPAVADVRELTALGPDLYFAADDRSNGASQLYRSDGTAAGTQLVFAFAHASLGGSFPPRFTRVGQEVFFVANADNLGELWKTDGTAAGTVSVTRDLPTGRQATNLTAWNGAVYYLADAGGAQGRGLWRSDGTAAGTVLLKALGANSFPSLERAFFTPYAGQLFFAADDGEHGRELWQTDGTAAGTLLVRDLQPGSGSGNPAFLVAAAGLLFFAADDGEHGAELWQSDGTAPGTRLVQDLAPGALSADPQDLTVVGNQLFFSADDGIYGREVWVYPLAAAGPGCRPSDTALCLHGGRFQVEAEWQDFAGHTGMGHAAGLTDDTGTFWFFDPANVEVVLKVLDGRPLNGHFWTFYGALSSVRYTLTVTDVETGATRRYTNPPGHLGSVGDTQAFGPLGARSPVATAPAPEAGPAVTVERGAATAACVPSPTRFCLADGRFAVEASWRDFQGRTGMGMAVPLTSDTGYFWFFAPTNVEVMLKVLDGRALNGKFWVFYGALSNVEYSLTVTDLATGTVRTYRNPSGHFASVADTGAF
jgi:ELWxxDGT repeat protein